jgi:hypothetical protein
MLRTGQLPAPLRGGLPPPRRRDLAQRRECRYPGPWRLPGPDSHRLAAVSLALGYTSLLLSSLRRPSYWTHIPQESSVQVGLRVDRGREQRAPRAARVTVTSRCEPGTEGCQGAGSTAREVGSLAFGPVL